MSAPMAGTRGLVLRHWATANARDWAGFRALLADDLAYEVPQTREHIDSGEGYLEMFRTWPGPWSAQIEHLVCEGEKAVCVIAFVVGTTRMTGISVFEAEQGRLKRVTDYWPEPYEPPARHTPHMKRRPA